MTDAKVEVEVFEREDGLFDWRRVARRGNLPDEIVAGSAGQGYTTVGDARDAALRENEGLPVLTVSSEKMP